MRAHDIAIILIVMEGIYNNLFNNIYFSGRIFLSLKQYPFIHSSKYNIQFIKDPSTAFIRTIIHTFITSPNSSCFLGQRCHTFSTLITFSYNIKSKDLRTPNLHHINIQDCNSVSFKNFQILVTLLRQISTRGAS